MLSYQFLLSISRSGGLLRKKVEKVGKKSEKGLFMAYGGRVGWSPCFFSPCFGEFYIWPFKRKYRVFFSVFFISQIQCSNVGVCDHERA